MWGVWALGFIHSLMKMLHQWTSWPSSHFEILINRNARVPASCVGRLTCVCSCNRLSFLLFNSCIYLAVLGSSLLHAGFFLLHAGFLQLRGTGATLQFRALASRCSAFSCCRAQALRHSGFSSCGSGAEELQLVGSRAQAQ